MKRWQVTERYYPFGTYLKEVFGEPIRKISIDAGFTCPNIDGTVAVGGCTFCSNAAFVPDTASRRRSITEQMEGGTAGFLGHADGPRKWLAYFQAHTNTHGPVERLKSVFDEAIAFPGVVGLAIGTRPDAVPDNVLDLLEGYARDRHIWVEFGLQTIHERTQRLINRAHDLEVFDCAVRRTRERGIHVACHLILGLPGETREDMCATADYMAQAGVDGVKIHHLYIADRTRMARDYREGKVPVLDWPEYVPLAADMLERIPEGVKILRLTGDSRHSRLLAPVWDVTVARVRTEITRELERRGTRQGSRVARGAPV